MAFFGNKMLPKDILNLIDNYNEDGVFIYRRGRIFWFNGKRTEPFGELFYVSGILTYNNNLYVRNYGTIHVYKNKKFHDVDVSTKWDHPLQIFKSMNKILYNKRTYELRGQNLLYYINIEVFDGERTQLLPMKMYPQSGFKLFVYDNYLYCFGFRENEKFNFLTQKWELFATTPNHHHPICFFKGYFYIFTYDEQWIYYPDLDTWKNFLDAPTRCFQYNC